MPFAEAVARAGSLEALVTALRKPPQVFARCSEWRTWPDGNSTKSSDRNIDPTSWNDAHDIDSAAGRAVFTFVLFGILEDDKHDVTFELLAIGIEIEAGGVDALWPVKPKPPKHAGGRDPDNDWEGAAGHVDAWVHEHGPLPRKKDGTPNAARAVGLMTEWFKTNEPPPPKRESIYRWLRENPHPEWWL